MRADSVWRQRRGNEVAPRRRRDLAAPRRPGGWRHLGSRLWLALALALTLAHWPAADSLADDPPAGDELLNDSTASGAPVPTPALVKRRIEETKASTTLGDAAKAELLEQYQSVLGALEQRDTFATKAQAFRKALTSAPKQAEQIRAETQAARDQEQGPPVDLTESTPLSKIEGTLSQTQAEAASVDAQLTELEQQLEDADQEPARARARLSEAQKALDKLTTQLGAPPPDGLNPAQVEARQWLLEAQREALRSELLMLDQEILSADARRELLSAQRDQKELEQHRLRDRRAYLVEAANRLRQQEAEQMSAETAAAARDTANAHPLVRKVAEENRQLGDTLGEVTQRLDTLKTRQARIEEQTQQVEQEFRNARQRLEAAGLNRALGQLLLDQRSQLPDPATLRKEIEQRTERIADVTLAQIRDREELRRLTDLDSWLDEQLATVQPPPGASVRDDLRVQAERRRALLARAIDIEDSYRRTLSEVNFSANRLLETVRRYEDYLAERLLWVRSIPSLSQQDFAALPAAIYWLISPGNWAEVLAVALTQATRSPLLWLGLLAVGLLLWRGAPIRRRIRALAEPLRRISTDRFSYTLRALGLTLLAAAPWPLLLAVIGRELVFALDAGPFPKAIGAACLSIAPALFYLRAFQLLCMSGGVADRHFRWSSDVLRLLRRTFTTITAVLLPIGYVAAAVYFYDDRTLNASLGRLSLAAFEFGLALFTATLLHPRSGALRNVLAEHPDGWAHRLRNIWYPLVVAVPAALGVLVLIGYMYTSGTLLESLVSELWMVLGLVTAHQLIVRWLMVTRRSLALQAALDRRAQREAQRAAELAGGAKPTEVVAPVEDEVDLASLDSQTRRLLNTVMVLAAAGGLWLIWSDVLPALNVLDRVTLWSYTATVDGVDKAVPVTLASLGLVLVIVAVAVAAGKNLPALVEILLLQYSKVDAGTRYTIITLLGYAITAVAALFVFSTLGLSWGQVQWLVAALGVGIGFGLQEIVANFISGLIILFERPVRVGDIVTIGDTTGAVTKIEIRATTIRNWDRQELLVPNKEFITGRLLNWTLTDQINRIVITVGVEYGSDTRRALQLLRSVATEHPRILAEPEPLISFEGFGDNALTLVLRCYMETLDGRIDVISALHQAIDDKFREAGIGIAFPQRDVHLRSGAPLEVRLSRAHTGSGDAASGRGSGDAAEGGAAAATG